MVRAAGRHRIDGWGMPTPRVHRNQRRPPPKPLRMITRGEWEALPPLPDNPGPRLELPVRHIRYTFTRTDRCEGPNECIPLIQNLQKNAQSQGKPDLMFNFLVGGDGLIYEGRGWDYNCTGPDYFVDSPGPSINIAYIGTYEDTLAPCEMRQSGEHIRKWALFHNLLASRHEITPSLACFKEGEENVDLLAEAVARFGLDIEKEIAAPVKPLRRIPSSDEEEGSEEVSEEGSDEGSDDGSDEGSDDASDDGSDDGSDDNSDEGSDDGSEDDSDEGSDDDSDEGSDDDSDEGSEDGSDDDSDEGSDDDSDDDSDDESDDDSDDGSDDGSDDSSDDDSDDGSDDGSDEGNDDSSDDDSDDDFESNDDSDFDDDDDDEGDYDDAGVDDKK